MSNISKKLTDGEQCQKAFDAAIKKSKRAVPEDFYKKFTEYFKTLTTYESIPIHIGKGRDVSYDALIYAITHEYEYYVTFRTEEKDTYCPHPCYVSNKAKREIHDDERSCFIGKPLEVIDNYICEKNPHIIRSSYNENNYTCYLYGFQKPTEDSRSYYEINQYENPKYHENILFLRAQNNIVDHYTRFETDPEDACKFYGKIADLFYSDSMERIEKVDRIIHKR